MAIGDLAKAVYGRNGKRKNRRRVRKDANTDRIARALKEERSRLAQVWADVSISEATAIATVADSSLVVATVEGAYSPAAEPTRKALLAGLGIGGDIALEDLAIATLQFNLTNPLAVEWASTKSANLIVEVSTEQVATVRSVIAEGLTSGKGARVVAVELRETIGLHRRYATAVDRFRERHLTQLIKQHPRTPISVLQGRADAKAARYADRLRRSRAKTIARTELQRAANEGQRQAWQQAVQAGELEVTNAEREYIATLGGHAVCDDQDGIRIPWDGEFPVAGDPPIHPNCGCTFGLRKAEVLVPSEADAGPLSISGPTITSAQVNQFLANSQVTKPVVHRTSTSAARSIRKGGVDFSKTAPRSTFGEGFYTSEEAITFYGDEQLSIAIRSQKPFRGTAQQMDDKITSFALEAPEKTVETVTGEVRVAFWESGEQQRAIRQAFLDEGFDSLIVESGNDIIIGLVEDNIKVVVN
ncbi:hypothetical protein LCGC14_0826340 [marine sediment metagenome]|uniref:Phage head morphogenesis domain-containing protein n=1 Tax=marine sediment metagenome TaxID=412755 RepID=A0A0F9S229_9ZZZZ